MKSVQLSAVSFRLVPWRLGAFAFLLLPSLASAEVIHLDAEQVAVRAVEVSHLAVASTARVEGARAAVSSADAAALPVVAATASASQRSSVPEFSVPIFGPGEPALVLVPDITTTASAGLGVQQVLYAGGAVDGGRRAARHDEESAVAVAAATVADVRLNARLAYWDAVTGEAAVELARAQLRRAERLDADTRALLEAGMAVRADTLAAEERVATARVELVRAQAEAANARERLRSLLQLGPDDELQFHDTLAGRLPGEPGSREELVANALADRPELAAARARLAALGARKDQARAQGRPRLAASALVEEARPNARYFPPEAKWQDSWAVAVTGSWNLFDGGRWRWEAAAVGAEERATTAELAELERQVAVDVDGRRRDLEASIAAVPAADAARAAAQAREQEARERHAAGVAAMVEILDAQELLAAAETRQVGSRAAAFVAAARLERAVGR